MRKLPLSEAYLLAMSFEEEAAYNYRQQRDMKSHEAQTPGYRNELIMSDDNEDEAVYADVEEYN